jgi:hypothetical protein
MSENYGTFLRVAPMYTGSHHLPDDVPVWKCWARARTETKGAVEFHHYSHGLSTCHPVTRLEGPMIICQDGRLDWSVTVWMAEKPDWDGRPVFHSPEYDLYEDEIELLSEREILALDNVDYYLDYEEKWIK